MRLKREPAALTEAVEPRVELATHEPPYAAQLALTCPAAVQGEVRVVERHGEVRGGDRGRGAGAVGDGDRRDVAVALGRRERVAPGPGGAEVLERRGRAHGVDGDDGGLHAGGAVGRGPGHRRVRARRRRGQGQRAVGGRVARVHERHGGGGVARGRVGEALHPDLRRAVGGGADGGRHRVAGGQAAARRSGAGACPPADVGGARRHVDRDRDGAAAAVRRGGDGGRGVEVGDQGVPLRCAEAGGVVVADRRGVAIAARGDVAEVGGVVVEARVDVADAGGVAVGLERVGEQPGRGR